MSQPNFTPPMFAWYEVAGTEILGGETGSTYAMRVADGYCIKTLDWKDGAKADEITAMAASTVYIPHPMNGARVTYPPPADEGLYSAET